MSKEGGHKDDTMEAGAGVVTIPLVPSVAVSMGGTIDPTLTGMSASTATNRLNSGVTGIKGAELSMDSACDCEMKLLQSGNIMIATAGNTDTPVAGQEGTLLSAATSLVDSDVGQLSIVDSQPGMSSPFQPGVIYVPQSEGQLAEQGLLLASDSGTATLSLDHADLIPSSEAMAGEVSQELAGVTEGQDQFTVLQPSTDDTSSKFVDLSTLQSLDGNFIINPNQLQNLLLKKSSGETIQVVAIQNLFPIQIGSNEEGSSAPGQLLQNTVTKSSKDGSTSTLDINPEIQLSQPLSGILVAGAVSSKPLPEGAPPWATRINDCEKIGDSFRGWVETEMDLDLLLTFHKQQTHSFWGTRQSPSPAKPSTRLMWKSQYVPFDGIPFVNAGSRAIVLECQFGPRRKGAHSKCKSEEAKGIFKQTCPARIYIKKVKKFPEFAVNINDDKKLLKLNMDKAFVAIREMNLSSHGQERYYVQLPTEEAHEFHGESTTESPHRLDPRVADKIRDLVATGQTRLYEIRKSLRRFVEKELFSSSFEVPEKHNLTFYPTVNDLQNHIHQAIADMEAGLLPVRAPMVKVEMVPVPPEDDPNGVRNLPLWQLPSEGQPHTESVTVTLTQGPDEDGHHVISKVETHMSDGTTQVTTNLTPETARLLAKLHPNMFPADHSPQSEDPQSEPVSEKLAQPSLEAMETSNPLSTAMDTMSANQALAVMEGVQDGATTLILGEGSNIVKIENDMQISGPSEHDQPLKIVSSKLVEDEDDLAHYDPSCVQLRPEEMSGVVDSNLEDSMESSAIDKTIDSEGDMVHVLTITQ